MKLQRPFFMILLSSTSILLSVSLGAEDDYRVVGEYKYLGGNLYEKGDQLFFVTERVMKTQERKRPRYELVYLKRFSFFDEDKKQLAPLLAELIDRDSWKQISKFFYRDKSRLYCFSPSSDGGYLNHMEGVEPDELKFLYGDGWGDPAISGSNSTYVGDYVRRDLALISWYATDGISVFYRCRRLESADYSSFRLVTDEDSAWTAMDKNYFYDGGWTVKR